jgi:hypothetical protein
VPLIVVDTVGLLCAGLTLAVALSLRRSGIRPAAWNSRNTTAITHRPAGPDPQPHTHRLFIAGERPSQALADRAATTAAAAARADVPSHRRHS